MGSDGTLEDTTNTAAGSVPDSSVDVTPEERDDTVSHDIPMPEHLREAISSDWDPAPPMPHPARPDGAAYRIARRAALSEALPGRVVVVPGGTLAARANDTDYPFRAASVFTWLTGETEADAVLVMYPDGAAHDSVLYVREFAQPGEVEYFTSRMHGAVWVGNVPNLADTERALRITTRPLAALGNDLRARRGDPTAVL